MKWKLALAIMLCAIVSILSLNFGLICRNVAVGEGNAYDDEDAPIEIHCIYDRQTS